MLQDGLFLARPEAGEQQDAAGDAGLAELHAFVGGGDAEPGGALLFEAAGASDSAVSVGVGLDHGAHRGFGGDQLLESAKVVAQSR